MAAVTVLGYYDYKGSPKGHIRIEFVSEEDECVSVQFFKLLSNNMKGPGVDRKIHGHYVELIPATREVDKEKYTRELKSFGKKQIEVIKHLFNKKEKIIVDIRDDTDPEWNISEVHIYVHPEVFKEITDSY